MHTNSCEIYMPSAMASMQCEDNVFVSRFIYLCPKFNGIMFTKSSYFTREFILFREHDLIQEYRFHPATFPQNKAMHFKCLI